MEQEQCSTVSKKRPVYTIFWAGFIAAFVKESFTAPFFVNSIKVPNKGKLLLDINRAIFWKVRTLKKIRMSKNIDSRIMNQ